MSVVWTDGGLHRSAGMVMSRPFPAGGGGTLSLTDDYTPTYLELWRTQSSVRTVVSFLGRNIAQLGLHVYARHGDTDRERVTTGAVAELIARPNSWTTRYRWMDALVHDMGIYNRALFHKKWNNGRLSLVRVDPRTFTVKFLPNGAPDKFIVRYQGERDTLTVEYQPDQVVFFRGYEAQSSPLESLRQELAESYAASTMRQQVYNNGSRASGYLERPIDAPKWSGEARDRFREQWKQQYVGASADSPGGTPILEDGMKFTPATTTPVDMQYLEARKLTRQEVAAAYFIPPPMVGILENATYSNVREQHKHLYMDTLGPWLTMITDELSLQLLPDLTDDPTLYVEFNLKEKLSGSFEEQAQQKQKAVGGPWLTRNEARAMENRAPIEGGDELIVPLAVTSGGLANPTDTAPDDPDNTESNRRD